MAARPHHPQRGLGRCIYFGCLRREQGSAERHGASLQPGEVLPHAKAKGLAGSPVLLLPVTWMSHIQPPRPLPGESIPLQHPSPGSPGGRRFTQRTHSCGCSKSFSSPFPAGWQRTSAVSASLWTAARPATWERDLVPQHHFGVTRGIPRSCRSIQAPEPCASPELSPYQTAHWDTASSQIRAAHPHYMDWDRATEGRSGSR